MAPLLLLFNLPEVGRDRGTAGLGVDTFDGPPKPLMGGMAGTRPDPIGGKPI